MSEAEVDRRAGNREHHWFSTDRPIESRSEDLLGRAAFASQLARAVASWRQKDSLVIALYGPWGSGKSSVKNMMREALTESADAVFKIVEFDPWQWAGQSELAEGFFGEMGIALGAPDRGGEARKRALRWNLYRARLRVTTALTGGVRSLLAGVLVLAGVAGIAGWTQHAGFAIGGLVLLVLAGLVKWSERTAGGIADVAAARAALENKPLGQLKEDLASLTAELKRPLMVIVDDIDRLPPSQIRLLFQLIKANADFPNFVYLLLFQRDSVERSLKDDVIEGREFLEKIVQIGFDIPVVSRQRLENVLFAGLNQILADEAVGKRFDKDRWGNVYVGGLRPFFESLRDVRRYLSTLSFTVSLLKYEETFEVNPIDLMAVEALRVFVPEVYSALAQAREVMTQTRGGVSSGEETEREAVTSIIDPAPPQRKDLTRELIRQLFPTVEWALGGPTYVLEFLDEWQRELRVCHPNMFDRYFELSVREDDLSQRDLDRILALAGDLQELEGFLRGLHERGMLETALRRLEAYKEQVELANAEPFVTAIFNVGDLLPKERVGFDVGADMHAVRIVHWFLKQEADRSKRGEILRKCMEQSSGLYLPVMKTSLETRKNDSNADEDSFLVEPDQVAELREICVSKIEEAASKGSLQDQPHLAYILYRWSEWASPDKPREWAQRLLDSSDAGGLTLLKAFTQESTSYGMGDHTARSRSMVRLTELLDFVNLEDLSTKVGQVEEIPEEARESVDAFRRALKRREEGRSDEEWD
jgi:predicted KAP-like P-loop ATPase